MALTEMQIKKFEMAGRALKMFFNEAAQAAETTHDLSRINDYVDAVAVWKADEEFERGDVRKDPEDGIAYWALHNHRAADYGNVPPHEDMNLWRECHGTSVETAHPFKEDAANLYYKGHFATENDHAWEYISDTPSAYAPSVVPAYWQQAD